MTRLAALGRDRRGSPSVEFALSLTVALALIMGASEVAYQTYVQSVFEGAVDQAGRDATLQGGANQTTAFDTYIKNRVQKVSPTATYAVTRTFTPNFSLPGPERFSDDNKNNQRDPGECYDDINGNGQYDTAPNVTKTGQGGADDVTKSVMTVTYRRLFPFAAMFGWSSNITLTAVTILKNQPYDKQTLIKTICKP